MGAEALVDAHEREDLRPSRRVSQSRYCPWHDSCSDSTTVDAEQLARCRRLSGLTPSKLLDRALLVLADELERERELSALERLPYEDDPGLSWEAGENLRIGRRGWSLQTRG